MTEPSPKKLAEFPAATYAAWRVLAEKELKGVPFDKKLVTHTYEQIPVQPVYATSESGPSNPSGLPGSPPYTRGAEALGTLAHPLGIRSEYAAPDPDEVAREMKLELSRGATQVLLRFDAASHAGLGADAPEAASLIGTEGVAIVTSADIKRALGAADPSVTPIALDAGASFVPASAMVAAAWAEAGVAPATAQGAWNADPLGVLAREGTLPCSPERALSDVAALAAWTSARFPRMTSVEVSASPYHDAGATAVQELACALGTGVAYLRALTEGGLTLADATKQMAFTFSIGCDQFLEIAKLRAARTLWGRVIEASGGADAPFAMRLHARMSQRVITARDPWVNMLRATVSGFAAVVGGADSVTVTPFDAAVGPSDAFARRIARNTAIILAEESQLARVIDPAGGSYYVEALTSELARAAWALFQQIEGHGGMAKALASGWMAEQISSVVQLRRKNIARRKDPITGVSEFPHVAEEPLQRRPADRTSVVARAKEATLEARRNSSVTDRLARLAKVGSGSARIDVLMEAARAGAALSQLAESTWSGATPTSAPQLALFRTAAAFERLRDASDAALREKGARPQAFLANLGRIAEHNARAMFARNFFEAGGFAVLTNDGFDSPGAAADAFAQSGAKLAVVCSSDPVYAEHAASAASALKKAGARRVVLAGNPGPNDAAWRAAGVDQFIFLGCDVIDGLGAALQSLSEAT